MHVGFIGLGNMGFPIARRLLEAGHRLVAFDTRTDAVERLVALGAQPASGPDDVANRAENVVASLPSPQASLDVAGGPRGIARGRRIRRFVDLSTVGPATARQIQSLLAKRGIVAVDSPVSGGVGGAERGTLAVMVSCPADQFDILKPILETIGRPFYLGDEPGSAQTMKLANNLLSATVLAATAEALAMGVKSGLDAQVMLDVLNAGSGATSASRDKFPRAVLTRTFDYGFATGLMVKDIRLYRDEERSLGLSGEIAAAVARVWELAIDRCGADSDFTSVVKPIEDAAGVVLAAKRHGDSV